MRFIELSGSPREIGRRHGAAFADDIQGYYEHYCLRRGKVPKNLDPSIPAYVEQRLPQVAAEIEGLAEGAGLRYDEMMTYHHFGVVPGCTPVFFRRSERGPLLAQNLDCEPEERTAQLVRRVVPDRGHAFLAVGRVGLAWCGNWINAAGLAKVGVSAHPEQVRTRDGTVTDLIQTAIAQEAGTLDEVFDRFSCHRCVGKVGVFLFADDTGRAMHVEGDADRKWRVDITDEIAYSAGLFITGRVVARDEPAYLEPKRARTETLDRLRREGRITYSLDGMKQLLAHHAPDPGSVCRHNRAAGGCTQSSRLMILRERVMMVADGPPCEHAFEPYTLAPAGTAADGATEG